MSKDVKIKMYRVSCMQEGCGNGFHIFRSDDKVPVEGIKCLSCETKDRQKNIATRVLRRGRTEALTIFVGSTDEAEKRLVRCE